MNIKSIVLVLVAAIFAVSCTKEETKTGTDSTQQVIGTYQGYSLANFKYTSVPMATENETVDVTAGKDGTVNVKFVSAKWGEFNISSAKVTGKDGAYVLNGQGKTLMGMSQDSKKEYDCSMTGTVDKKHSTAGFTFSVPSVMGGLNIEFYKGTMPAMYAVAGTYKGKLEMTVSGNVVGTVEDSQVIVEGKNDKATVTLKAFGFGSMQLQDIVIENVALASAGSGYSLSGDVNTTSGSVKVTGKIAGTIDAKGSADMTFTIKPGAMPMDITAKFTGSK